jgi:DNA-binding CsgD family transcriptional regulator
VTGLPGRDLRRILTWVGGLLEVRDHAGLVDRLLPGAAEVVGADTTTLTHLDLRSGREVAVLWPPSRRASQSLGAYPGLADQHPLRRPGIFRGPGRPVRISDVVSRAAWRRCALRTEAMPEVSDQLTIPLFSGAGTLQALALGRHGGTFTDRQRDLLGHAGVHLRAAVARATRERADGVQGIGLQLAPHPAWVALRTAPGLAPPPPPRREVRDAREPARAVLSGREREVLSLVAEGLTDAQVARRLQLRPATVSRHLHRIYERNGVANRVAAVGLL